MQNHERMVKSATPLVLHETRCSRAPALHGGVPPDPPPEEKARPSVPRHLDFRKDQGIHYYLGGRCSRVPALHEGGGPPGYSLPGKGVSTRNTGFQNSSLVTSAHEAVGTTLIEKLRISDIVLRVR